MSGISRKKHHQYDVKASIDLTNLPSVTGFDFNPDFDFKKLLESYATTGFQATNLGRAISIVKQMRKDNATIFLSYTSNMVSSGLRDIIRWLVEHKKINYLITTAGGIEEDILKVSGDFYIGNFDVKGRQLFNVGVSRIGNIFVSNERYAAFEQFMTPFLDEIQKQKKISGITFLKELGKAINDKSSILYWAYKNDIKVICPAFTDGALGDMLYFAKQRYPDFQIDILQDMKELIDETLLLEKSGVIALGGGVPKHYALNAHIFREGADYAVYLTTAQEFDGSDSGGNIEEAITWAKVKVNAPSVKVNCDATIIFPLLVAGAFLEK